MAHQSRGDRLRQQRGGRCLVGRRKHRMAPRRFDLRGCRRISLRGRSVCAAAAAEAGTALGERTGPGSLGRRNRQEHAHSRGQLRILPDRRACRSGGYAPAGRLGRGIAGRGFHPGGRLSADRRALADFAFSACYKWLLGCTGVAIAYWNRARNPNWMPTTGGWHSIVFPPRPSYTPDLAVRDDALRFTRGNPPHLPSMYSIAPSIISRSLT